MRQVSQQQSKRIAVSFDRARADVLLLDQAPTEEILDQGIEGRGHSTPPCVGIANSSKCRPAKANGSGIPVEYQKVSVNLKLAKVSREMIDGSVDVRPVPVERQNAPARNRMPHVVEARARPTTWCGI